MLIDLFFHQGKHITFDGHVHMTTMAQFASALKDGEFPVTWANNFANYGLPLPIFAHQLPAYLGALFILLGFSVLGAYNLTLFLAVLLSSLFFYVFARKYAKANIALVAAILMNIVPYRIANIYIRGALPEILASVFYPLILLGIYQFNKEKKKIALVLIALAVFLLAITHPMMLLIFAIPSTIYFLATLEKKQWQKKILLALSAVILGVFSAAYYLIPLNVEIRYFYQGAIKAQINSEQFLNLTNFLSSDWYYFYAHPGPRGNFIKFGLPEFSIFLLSLILLFKKLMEQKAKNWKIFFSKNYFFLSQLLITLIAIFLMLSVSEVLYFLIPGFASLQYPWRFLVLIQFSVPLLFLYLVKKISFFQKPLILFFIVTLMLIHRVPQLYGKNYAFLPEEKFYFNQSNLHSQNLNTVWSANSESYPVKTKQAEIIEGQGTLEIIELKNASRKYRVLAETELRLLDYTFYFPGWQVLANGEPVLVQFQDPEYRGLITYRLSPGEYELELVYLSSTVRLIAQIVSISALLASIFGAYLLFKKIYFKKF